MNESELKQAPKVAFKDHAKNIKSGDLLAWSHGTSNWLSKFFVWFVRAVTRSRIGHVGIAWKVRGELWVIEATLPFVRAIPLKENDKFYHIPVDLTWDMNSQRFLTNLIGFLYSLWDCVRAAFGRITTRDNNYQCAELGIDFFISVGIQMNCRYTPKDLVRCMLDHNGGEVYLVTQHGESQE